ncbi:MAG: glycosyltransferase family 9 protein [Burkholderiales bacterium]|jgi:heptosyltransferase-1|nr:glycosyltransferase family 9 protein [Burkholderiales bacterium]
MNHILIIRLSAIGDIVFASPFAAAVKKTYPNARLSWLVDQSLISLVDQSPYIDECIPIDSANIRNLWKSGQKREAVKTLAALGSGLKARQFDVAIDLQGLIKSGFLAWLTKAPRRISLGGREGSRFLMNEVYSRGGSKGDFGSEYRFLADQLKLDTGAFLPELFLNEEAQKTAQQKLSDVSLAPKKYMVFAAFTTRPQKHWFIEHWRELANHVVQQTPFIPVLLGGKANVESAQKLCDGTPIVNLVGQTSLAETMAMVADAGALIGVDTGLTHMGVAFNIPTVALFGSTCPYLDTHKNNAQVIWLHMRCSPCRRSPTCEGAWTCLKNITPERVIARLMPILDGAR